MACADGETLRRRDAYRRLSAHAAKGVGVVAAHHAGWDVVAPVTDHLSVSDEPPTMLVSLHALSRIAEAVTESRAFGLSLLAADQRVLAERLADPGAPLIALLDNIPHFRTRDGGPALLAGALAWFDLRVQAVHEAATHVLVVGRVEAMGSDARADAAPLVRYRSAYRT